MTVFPARATDFDRVPGPHDRRWRLPGPCRAGEKHISAARGLSASPRLNLPLFVQEKAGFRCIRARNRAPAGSGWGPRGARAESIRSFRVHSSTWPFSLVLDVEPRLFFWPVFIGRRHPGSSEPRQQRRYPCLAIFTPTPAPGAPSIIHLILWNNSSVPGFCGGPPPPGKRPYETYGHI